MQKSTTVRRIAIGKMAPKYDQIGIRICLKIATILMTVPYLNRHSGAVKISAGQTPAVIGSVTVTEN